jgi:hypothetical protein
VAQFAFARGNGLYRAAGGTKSSSDFALAYRFLAFADSVRPSAQSRFLTGATALGLAQTALTEATAPALAANKPQACTLARLGSAMIPVARTEIEAGAEVMPDAVKQSLDYLSQIEPYAGKELAAYCPAEPAGVGATETAPLPAAAAGTAGASSPPGSRVADPRPPAAGDPRPVATDTKPASPAPDPAHPSPEHPRRNARGPGGH